MDGDLDIDVEYCLNLIDIMLNQGTPPHKKEFLFAELLECSKHEELCNIIHNLKADGSRREEFRIKAYSLTGRALPVDPVVQPPPQCHPPPSLGEKSAATEDNIDYVALLKKMLDPNISDVEVKPTMQKLLGGGLNEDQAHLVRIILNCKNESDRESMVYDFEKSFKKEKAKEKKVEKKKEKPPDIDYLKGDFRTLIDRLLVPNKVLSKEKRSEIYQRLMEPDVEADYKNLAIKIVNASDKETRLKIVTAFDTEKERQRLTEAARQAAEEARKAAAEEKQRAELERIKARRQEKEKARIEEKMKRRDLMLRLKAEQNRRAPQDVLKSSNERELERRREMERVKEEMRMFREKRKLAVKEKAVINSKKNMGEKSEEAPRRNQALLTVIPYDKSIHQLATKLTVKIPDVGEVGGRMHLSRDQQEKVAVLLAKLNGNRTVADKSSDKPTKPAVSSEVKRDKDKGKENEKEKKMKRDEKESGEKEKSEGGKKEEDELEKYFQLLLQLDAAAVEEETNILKDLIKEQKWQLVRELVIKLSPIRGTANSKLFATLVAKFVGVREFTEDRPVREAAGSKATEPNSDAATAVKSEAMSASCEAKSIFSSATTSDGIKTTLHEVSTATPSSDESRGLNSRRSSGAGKSCGDSTPGGDAAAIQSQSDAASAHPSSDQLPSPPGCGNDSRSESDKENISEGKANLATGEDKRVLFNSQPAKAESKPEDGPESGSATVSHPQPKRVQSSLDTCLKRKDLWPSVPGDATVTMSHETKRIKLSRSGEDMEKWRSKYGLRHLDVYVRMVSLPSARVPNKKY